MIYIVAVVGLGLLTGSFLNVVIYRLPRQESVIWPGSHCPACGCNLQAWELMPIISYLWLHGRCSHCKDRISPRYILVEVLTASTFLWVYHKWGITIETGMGFIFAVLLIITAFTDIEAGVIPNRITYPGLIMGLLLSTQAIGIKASMGGAIFFAGILMAIAILSRGGMGGGDIKLAGVIGSFIGYWGALLTLMIASLAGGIWAAVLLCRGKADRKTAIKFGPFLAAAAWLVWLYEGEILDILIQIFT